MTGKMYNPIQNWLLTILKVPPEPHPPAGSPGSVRVFRAGRNYFRLRLFGWGVGQVLALAGIIFWVVVLIEVESEAGRRKQTEETVVPFDRESLQKTIETFARKAGEAARGEEPALAETAASTEGAATGEASAVSGEPREAVPAEQAAPAKNPRRRGIRILPYDAFKQVMVELAMRLPDWAFPLVWVMKIGGIVVYLVQIPITYFLRRLDFEMRWYIVTDRSLRLRWGVAKVQETTMSFANLQQVELMQNPIERILGLGDVRVQSAGGGSGGGKHEKGDEDSMHRAHFHAVDNAQEIRDLILERLRRFRQTGLGDPDDHHHEEHSTESAPAGSALDAAREVLAEARALRAAIR